MSIMPNDQAGLNSQSDSVEKISKNEVSSIPNSTSSQAKNQSFESPINIDVPQLQSNRPSDSQESLQDVIGQPVNPAKCSDDRRTGAQFKFETDKVPPNEVNYSTPEETDKKRVEQFLNSIGDRPSLSGGWTYFNRGDCPVCQGERKDCRQSKSTGLVHCLGKPGSGWEYIKEDSNGFPMYKSDAQAEVDRAEWLRRKQEEEALRKKLRAEIMPVGERNRHFERVLNELPTTLHPEDLADLERRRITPEQIKRWDVQSLSQWQKIGPGYPNNLPGKGKYDNIKNSYEGYIVPTRDAKGRITSLGQIRNRAYKPGNGHPKYPWITGKSEKNPNGKSAHLPTDELPLQVAYPHEWKQSKAGKIGFCEGSGIKPHLAADRLGIPVIGASGRIFKPLQVEEYIPQIKAVWEEKTEGEVTVSTILLPDGGAIADPHTMKQYVKWAELVRKLGYTATVLSWGQHTKTDGDIDEISAERLAGAEIISFSQYSEPYSIQEQARKAENHQPIQKDQGPSRVERAVENFIPFLSEQGDDRQYFGDSIAGTLEQVRKDGDRALIVQAGPPNTGKSTSAKAARKAGQKQGRDFIAITPLESSAKGLASKDNLDIPYRKNNFKGLKSYSMCTNALRPDAQNVEWNELGEQTDILLDEASESNQLLSGLNAEATMKRKIGQKVLSNSQTVTAQSATLKQYDIELFKHLGSFTDDQVHIDAISSAPHPRNITIYHQDRERGDIDPKPQLLLEMLERVKAGETAEVISVDSQKPFSRWGTWTLEAIAKNAGIPADRVIRFDSQTNKDPHHLAHKVAKTGKLTLENGYLYINSPSNETNISYLAAPSVEEVNHTTFDTGSMTVERIYQSCRVRGRDGLVINQNIAVGNYIGKLFHGDAFTPEEVWDDIQRQASNGQAQKFHRLMNGNTLQKDNLIVRNYCIRQADKACSLIGKHRILPNLLTSQGHSVRLGSAQKDEQIAEFKEQLEDERQIIKQLFYTETREAQRITLETYEARQKKGEYSRQEWIEMQRFQTERLLGNNLTEKVKDGAIVKCDEGIELTEDFIDAVCSRRLIRGWRRTFDALYCTEFDWFLKSLRKLDGETPSIIDSCRSPYAQFTTLKNLGIISLVRKWAILETLPDFDYPDLLQAKKPSEAFQKQMVMHFKDRAFTYQDPDFQSIVEKLSQPGELERVTALLGIRGIVRNAKGNVASNNVMTIIRRFFSVRTFRSNSVRVNGSKGAIILHLDDRAHELYELFLAADKAEKTERLGFTQQVEDALDNVNRSEMFSTWNEARKVSGAIAIKNVPLLQKLESLSIRNNGTNGVIDFAAWSQEIGVTIERPLEVLERVQRTDNAGWGGIIKSIRGAIADVVFDLEEVTKTVPIDFLARV